jgi:tetratricopeptide (TPR) repeat protein
VTRISPDTDLVGFLTSTSARVLREVLESDAALAREIDVSPNIPLVLADTVPKDDRARFEFVTRDPTELPREPIPGRCRIEESIDHMEIRFTTSCPGKPHWIAVSYFPNWQVEGAKHVFLASPAFMMVYPDQPTVTLRFQRIGSDWLGIACTLLGIVLCLVPLPAPRTEAIDRGLTAAHPVLVPAATVVILLLTAWSAGRDFGPSYFYQRGWAAFSSENYDTAVREFDWAILLGGETNTAGDATFFRAASLLRKGDPEGAMEGYRDIAVRFPASIWVAESIYHVGLCLRQLGRYEDARVKFAEVIDGYPGNRWAGFAEEQIQQMRDAGQVPPSS